MAEAVSMQELLISNLAHAPIAGVKAILNSTYKAATALVAIALLGGVMTAHAADADLFDAEKAYARGDYAMALPILRKIADNGGFLAQFRLGLMYYSGKGVPQDYKEAVRWYRKAADQGYDLARFALGSIYENGYGVTQDYVEAVKWYRKAADQGNAGAQHNQGAMYAEGRGVTQDYVQAHMWLNIAAARGDQDARETRDKLARVMSASQIADAQRLARQWKPTSQ